MINIGRLRALYFLTRVMRRLDNAQCWYSEDRPEVEATRVRKWDCKPDWGKVKYEHDWLARNEYARLLSE